MILGHRGIEPQTITHNIGIRNRLKGLGGTNQYIATDNHRMDTLGSHPHHLLVKWQLYAQQILREFLTTLPTEHRDGNQNLS